MSASELPKPDIPRLLDQLERIQSDELIDDEAARLLKLAARLYSEIVTRERYEVPLGERGLTATDAVVAVSALLRAQDLNPFDLSLWFGQAVLDDPKLMRDDSHDR